MIDVIDSSVAFKWHVQEDGTDRAIQVRDEFIKGNHTLLAPHIFPIEITRSLTREERQGRITPADGACIFRIGSSHFLACSPTYCSIRERMRSPPKLVKAFTIVFTCLSLKEKAASW